MPIYLLDDTLKVDIFFETADSEFADNICICVEESCPPDEKLFRQDEIHIYLTREQARQLGEALLGAVEESGEERG